MMSKGQWKDFFAEIRKSMNRYLSILFMVALGTAFFSGLRSSEPDMQASLDFYMDQTGYMNIRVIGTLGLTDADVMAIGAVKGVTDAEGMYSADVLSDLGDSPKVIHVQSLTGDISQMQLKEGRLPKAPDECVADKRLCETFELAVGDRITVYSTPGAELEDSLAGDTFIITGIGISPDYLTFERGSSSIGTGSVSGFIGVDKSAFTAPAYSQVFVRSDMLDGYNCFSDEYEKRVKELAERIEAIAGQRCEIRYAELTGEGLSQVADAREELENAKTEADEQFKDAWAQITEGQETIRSGWEELNASQEQVNAGRAEYESGTKTFNDYLAQLEDGERQIAEARALLEEKDAELNAARVQVEAGWEAYRAGEAELAAAKAEIEENETRLAAIEQIAATAKQAFDQAKESWEARKAQHDADQAALDEEKAASEAAGIPWQLVPELVARQQTLDREAQTIIQLETQLAPLESMANEAFASVEEGRRQLEEGKAQYEAGIAQLESSRQELDAAQSEIDNGAGAIYVARTELEAREKELADARAELVAGRQELEDAKTELEDAQAQINAGRTELTEGEDELGDSITEYEKAKADAQKQFDDAEGEIADALAKIDEVEMPEWYVLDRDTVQNYVEYDLDAQKIGALANVFPVLFFFVAALVSLTTMTRMVEEQRTQIGTLKALGYSSGSIALKYILYALSATLAGSVLGVLVGSRLIPWVVITAYGILYENMPAVVTPVQPLYAVAASAMAVLSTVGATWMACHRALTAQPAELMRPVAPTKGKRIFLERLPFIWKHLNFSMKSTLRNLFRYKKRLFMTLFGIGACMALLLVGYGIQDSIEAIVNRQYHTVWVYDWAVYLKDADDREVMEELDRHLTDSDQIGSWLDVCSEEMEAAANDAFKSITLLIPSEADRIDDFIKLKSRTGKEEYALDDHTALISEKLAVKLSLKVGDTMTIRVDETESHEVTVGGIVENYMYYYVYLHPAAYEDTFGRRPEWNQRLIRYADGVSLTEQEEDVLSGELLELDAVNSLMSSSSLRSMIKTMLKALDYVVLLLIGAAALLAFVVLYNLNNINITERKRELATIKLLGFYPGELAAYVYRENIILTVLGIGVGLLLGTWLTNYVIETVEIDMIMFGRGIDPESYLISALITGLFSVMVNVVMYFRLQKIDMIESLKSVE